MVKVGIIGAAGYTAGEALRILINHPNVEIVFAQSSSNPGKPIYTVHKDLIGDTDLVFSEPDYDKVDVIFICSGHGLAKKFLDENPLPAHVKVIDLSTDFRHKREGNPFVYGLPEVNKELIRNCNMLANPGCFATAIQLGLLPLASKGLLIDDVHINAVTGSTGAGQKPTGSTHFSWRNNNISAYKPFEHQHLQEIGETLAQLQEGFNESLNFVPVRGTFTRGILAMMHTKSALSATEAIAIYQDYYANEPFTHVVDEELDVKMVVNTNKCLIRVEKFNDYLFITSTIDNLLKGASGQAVQNMNLMFGLEENAGLRLKPVAF
ncbi:MAG: hypothetical protein RIS47_1192 [Bacteroidota bacterium]|jgi:N-acetyl-gamma-glutamyl-phosphate reductase